MKRKNFYEFPELELTEFRSEEGVFSSQIEGVKETTDTVNSNNH